MSDGKPSITAERVADDPNVPLCVDLDGTLTRTDMLVESIVRLLRQAPLSCLRIPGWLLSGRARLKEELAARVEIDPATLPYDEAVVERLRAEKKSGRPILLVTASHGRPAAIVARHVGLFDEVLATDRERNLKGRRKRDVLVERFGEGGFDYIGDSSADLPVWNASRHALAANASGRVLRALASRRHEVVSDSRKPWPLAVWRAIRGRQWVKNLLLLLPLLLAHRYSEGPRLVQIGLAIISFSLGCSAVYVLNDLLDVDSDRHHPVKRRRPFAAGDLPLTTGLALVPVLLAGSLFLASWLPAGFLITLASYFLVTTLYSFVLKGIALIDILTLASLYTLRIFAGAVATDVPVSEWLLAFSVFIFFSLGALKRYSELLRVRGSSEDVNTKVRGRGYFAGDSELVVQMGLASGYIAVLVLALYFTSDTVSMLYPQPALLWLTCPLVMYWISRAWLLAHRGDLQEDPVSFAVRDPVTWVIALLSGGVIILSSRGL